MLQYIKILSDDYKSRGLLLEKNQDIFAKVPQRYVFN